MIRYFISKYIDVVYWFPYDKDASVYISCFASEIYFYTKIYLYIWFLDYCFLLPRQLVPYSSEYLPTLSFSHSLKHLNATCHQKYVPELHCTFGYFPNETATIGTVQGEETTQNSSRQNTPTLNKWMGMLQQAVAEVVGTQQQFRKWDFALREHQHKTEGTHDEYKIAEESWVKRVRGTQTSSLLRTKRLSVG